MGIRSQIHLGTIRKKYCNTPGIAYEEKYTDKSIRYYNKDNHEVPEHDFYLQLGEIFDVSLIVKDDDGFPKDIKDYTVSISCTLPITATIGTNKLGLVKLYYEAVDDTKEITDYPYTITITSPSNVIRTILQGNIVLRDKLNTSRYVVYGQS